MYWQGCVSWGVCRGEPVSFPFPSSRGCLHSLAQGPSLHPRSQRSHPSLLSSAVTCPLTLLPPFPFFKGPL